MTDRHRMKSKQYEKSFYLVAKCVGLLNKTTFLEERIKMLLRTSNVTLSTQKGVPIVGK